MQFKPFNMDEFLEEAQKTSSKDMQVFRSDDISISSHIPYGIPTRIPQLDLALGRDGLPAGRVVEVSGFEHTGKSSLGLAVIAAAQRMGGLGIWIDAERAFSPEWARLNGCDPSRILLYQADTIEGLFECQAKAIEVYEKFNTNAPLVSVTDSVTAVSTAEEFDKDYEDVSRLGSDARAIRKCIKKINPKIADNKICALYITHSIAKTATTPFAKQSQSSGGHALKFFSTIRVELARVSTIKEKEKNRAGDEIQSRKGIEVGISIEKHKAGKINNLKLNCYLHETGFDLYENLFEALLHIGAVEATGRMFHVKFKQANISRKDWKEYVDNNCGGIDALYNWFLDVCVDKGYITRYSCAKTVEA